ncbi:Pro-resilin [Eumeta japonica]|uniref:Pro-resilin n=1 Tax=Eumeta variegata TaxID=151549 RepID=A0A4C1UKB2_EUMVA|nr:Pro-resilin [Eumeta japonica]
MSIYYALAGWSGNRERRDERTKRKRGKRKSLPKPFCPAPRSTIKAIRADETASLDPLRAQCLLCSLHHSNMKSIVALTCLVALAVAEPPPNSYLPPSPSGRNGGNGGAPQVAAARTNGFGRSIIGNQSPDDVHIEDPLLLLLKLTVLVSARATEVLKATTPTRRPSPGTAWRGALGGEPANYNFEYMVNDHHHGTDFGHHEERQDETARGEYHVVLPDGRKQTVNYEADERGFKPRVSYQGSEGYDSNAQLAGNGFGARSGGY